MRRLKLVYDWSTTYNTCIDLYTSCKQSHNRTSLVVYVRFFLVHDAVLLQMHVDLCAAELLRRGKQTDYCSTTSREVPAHIDRIPTSETTSRCSRAVTPQLLTEMKLSSVVAFDRRPHSVLIDSYSRFTGALEKARVSSRKISVRVVARRLDKLWIVCGNRRLHVSHKAARAHSSIALLLCLARLRAHTVRHPLPRGYTSSVAGCPVASSVFRCSDSPCTALRK